MKKSLLMIAACALMVTAIAQKPAVNSTPVKRNLNVVIPNVIDQPTFGVAPQQNANFFVKENLAFTPIRINSSGNIYGMLVSQENNLAANQDLNLIMMTHRGGPINGASGQILGSFSINGGTNWDTTNIIYDGNPNPGRYPSGVIYNPTSNTDINNAWAVVAGPALNPSGAGFGFDFFAWKKFNGATAQKYVNTSGDDGQLCRLNLQVTNNGTFWMTGDAHEDDGTYYTAFHHVLWKGVMASENITWTNTIITPNSLLNGGKPTGRPYSSVAFAPDGQIGYFICLGIPAGSTNYSYRPMVKKTTDGGANWVDMPDFDFGTLEQINTVLPAIATSETKVVPFFDIIKDAVVDANGNLHFVSFIQAGSTDNVDSIGYTWVFQNISGYIYDTYTTATGWDAEAIDIVYAKDAENALGTLTYDERLQMAISPDRTKIFYTWADTEPDYGEFNELPDLRISGFDINSKYRTESFNVTKNSGLEASAFYHTTAPQVWKTGDTYTLHNVVFEMGTEDVSPVNLYYLKGVEIMESDFQPVSVRNIDNTLANVSQNYPNPTNGMTSVDVSITKPTTLSIEVVNIMGQVVYIENKGKVGEGKYRFNFDASKFNSGIYFYTVKANNNAHTSKMIVQ